MSTIRLQLVNELNELHNIKKLVSSYEDYERVVKLIIVKERQLTELLSKQLNDSIPEYIDAIKDAKKATAAAKAAVKDIGKIEGYLDKAAKAIKALAFLLRLF